MNFSNQLRVFVPESYNLMTKYHNGDHFLPVTLCFSRTSYLAGNLRLVNTSSSFFRALSLQISSTAKKALAADPCQGVCCLIIRMKSVLPTYLVGGRSNDVPFFVHWNDSDKQYLLFGSLRELG